MNSLVFDTHAAATRFKAAGFTDDQVAVTRETTGLPDISTLATKADLERVETRHNGMIDRLQGKIDELRSELKAEFAELKVVIAKTQVQTVTIVLSSMVVIETLTTVVSKLMR